MSIIWIQNCKKNIKWKLSFTVDSYCMKLELFPKRNDFVIKKNWIKQNWKTNFLLKLERLIYTWKENSNWRVIKLHFEILFKVGGEKKKDIVKWNHKKLRCGKLKWQWHQIQSESDSFLFPFET